MPRTASQHDDVESLSDLVDGLTLRTGGVSSAPHTSHRAIHPSSSQRRSGKMTPPTELSGASSPHSSPPLSLGKAVAPAGHGGGDGRSASPLPPVPLPPPCHDGRAPDPRLRRPAPVSTGLRRQARRAAARPSGADIDPRRRSPGPVSVGRRHRRRPPRTTGAAGRPWRIVWWTLCGLALPLLQNPPRALRVVAALACIVRYVVMLNVMLRVLRRCARAPVTAEGGIPVALGPNEDKASRLRDKKMRAELPPRKEVMAWEEWAPRRARRAFAICVMTAMIAVALDVCVRLGADLAQVP